MDFPFNDYLPDVVFHMRERDPTLVYDKNPNPFVWKRRTTNDLFAGKKVIIFGLPGAFTPTCSNSQLPGFEKLYDEFKEEGIDEIWCTSVNDAFVMWQWKCHQNIKNVNMLPDGNGDFAEALGMLVDKSNRGYGKRSWRYAMLANDLKIERLWEEDGYPRDLHPVDPYDKSAPENILAELLN
jgi:thioredoxin-dependent peroxiredoxin